MKSTNGFTLLELLAVICLIAILLTMLFGAAQLVKRSARKQQIAATAKALESAICTYRHEYGKWPIPADADDILSRVISAQSSISLTSRAITAWSEMTASGKKVFLRCEGHQNYLFFDALRGGRTPENPNGISFVSDSSVDVLTDAGLMRRCYAPAANGITEAGHPLAFRLPKSGRTGFFTATIDFERDTCAVVADSETLQSGMFREDLFSEATHTVRNGRTTYYGACGGMRHDEIETSFRAWLRSRGLDIGRIEISAI